MGNKWQKVRSVRCCTSSWGLLTLYTVLSSKCINLYVYPTYKFLSYVTYLLLIVMTQQVWTWICSTGSPYERPFNVWFQILHFYIALPGKLNAIFSTLFLGLCFRVTCYCRGYSYFTLRYSLLRQTIKLLI